MPVGGSARPMKRLSMSARRRALIWPLLNTHRRLAWFLDNITPGRAANLTLALTEYAARRSAMRAWPVVLKVDISPLCNLRCTVCVHARPDGANSPALSNQTFKARQKMPLDAFRRIVDEVAGKTSALSLYYLGDPLMHPDLTEMCRYAASRRLNTHISTNFSFRLDDAGIDELVRCGLTHLTVCVDGLSQELYERTRVGGDVALVLENLERLLRRRNALGQVFPKVEVQFIKFQHNQHERTTAIARFAELGIDQFTEFWGGLFNYTDIDPRKYSVFGPKAAAPLPLCVWPHFAMVIKYDGDVIPCCNYRHGDQYRNGGDPRIVGNVLQTSVRAIWDSPRYVAMRRLVSNPRRAVDADGDDTFCSGCPTVFRTDADEILPRGDTHRWESIYEHDDKGHVRRRSGAGAQLVQLGRARTRA